MNLNRIASRAAVLVAAFALLGSGLVAACGGDDDDESTPSTAATSKPASAYRTQAKDLAEKLNTEVAKALGDMLSAQTSQTDPKWTTVLSADADLVTKAATSLKALQAPAEDSQVGTDLGKAADKATQGATALKASVEKADQSQGAVAFGALTECRQLLDAALAQLR